MDSFTDRQSTIGLQKQEQIPIRRSTATRPMSEATVIFDTDDEDFSDVEISLDRRSETTVSSLEDLQTPEEADFSAFNFQFEDSKPIQGPSGPHLFRPSRESSPVENTTDLYFYPSLSPLQSPDLVRPPTPPSRVSTVQTAIRDPLPTPRRQTRIRPFSTLNQAVAQLDEAEVRNWSPREVAEWMTVAGFEDTVVDKFLANDITGAILMELQFEDLKELDIPSFGKRHRLMNSIQHLRDSSSRLSLQIPAKSPLRSTSRSSKMNHSAECSPVSPDKEGQEDKNQRRRRKHRHHGEEISPAESVSIVAIEQLLPKPHKCSKGEDCPKWKKQQRKLAKLNQEFPIEPKKGGTTFIAGDPGNPLTADNVFRPKSEAEPSVVASSDVLGPGQLPQLSPESLSEVKPRDPQENVRQFLTFQHVSPSPADEPRTPPLELFPNMDSPRVHDSLRNLPRLTIPPQTDDGAVTSQMTITPNMIRKAKTPSAIADPYYNEPNSVIDVFRQGTPFSEMDVPVTAYPVGPIARETSQSVPPDMRYGADPHTASPTAAEPSNRLSRSPSHRRNPSFNVMSRVEELAPLNASTSNATSETANSAPTTAVNQSPVDLNPEYNHAGWMKKRKTTRLLRHEWQENYYTLKGTRLAMHNDMRHMDIERPSEYIDVDDYAVACSSLASCNKLTATFKKWAKASGASATDETAFAFQLIPADGKKNVLSKTGEHKTHHFAVKSRDQRIDWMRELMLAKALKQRGEGYEVNVNGTSF